MLQKKKKKILFFIFFVDKVMKQIENHRGTVFINK